jgi:hypothetical protein
MVQSIVTDITVRYATVPKDQRLDGSNAGLFDENIFFTEDALLTDSRIETT